MKEVRRSYWRHRLSRFLQHSTPCLHWGHQMLDGFPRHGGADGACRWILYDAFGPLTGQRRLRRKGLFVHWLAFVAGDSSDASHRAVYDRPTAQGSLRLGTGYRMQHRWTSPSGG